MRTATTRAPRAKAIKEGDQEGSEPERPMAKAAPKAKAKPRPRQNPLPAGAPCRPRPTTGISHRRSARRAWAACAGCSSRLLQLAVRPPLLERKAAGARAGNKWRPFDPGDSSRTRIYFLGLSTEVLLRQRIRVSPTARSNLGDDPSGRKINFQKGTPETMIWVMSAVRGPYRPFPTFMQAQSVAVSSGGKS